MLAVATALLFASPASANEMLGAPEDFKYSACAYKERMGYNTPLLCRWTNDRDGNRGGWTDTMNAYQNNDVDMSVEKARKYCAYIGDYTYFMIECDGSISCGNTFDTADNLAMEQCLGRYAPEGWTIGSDDDAAHDTWLKEQGKTYNAPGHNPRGCHPAHNRGNLVSSEPLSDDAFNAATLDGTVVLGSYYRGAVYMVDETQHQQVLDNTCKDWSSGSSTDTDTSTSTGSGSSTSTSTGSSDSTCTAEMKVQVAEKYPSVPTSCWQVDADGHLTCTHEDKKYYYYSSCPCSD